MQWLTFALAGLVLSQLAAQSFEVASLKPSTSGVDGVRGGCRGIDSQRGFNRAAATTPLGRCVITDGRLSHLIAIAFGLGSVRTIENAPDWVIAGSERFTIQAKAENSATTTEAELLRMLQSLLIEEFKLKFHRETKVMPGFAMVVARNGPKLRPAAGEASAMDFAGSGPISLNVRKFSLAALANLLSQIGPGPVIDETELTGHYDIQLAWDDSAGPSMFTALQEQLGLKLEPRKVPVSFFVIDSAERPSAN